MSINREYRFYVKLDPIVLQDKFQCPLYNTKSGKCYICEFFNGLNVRLFREGRCGLKAKLRNVEYFRVEKHCPKPSKKNLKGDCLRCEDFLGFSNEGFYCKSID